MLKEDLVFEARIVLVSILENNMTQTLYEKDFNLWIETTVSLLRDRHLEQIDYENLVEELESMGRSEKNALKSNLRILLMHLLKWKYQSERRSNSWRATITEHRIRLIESLESSPSLVNYFEEVFDQCYQNARRLASDETELSIITFPTESPFVFSEILHFDYLPD